MLSEIGTACSDMTCGIMFASRLPICRAVRLLLQYARVKLTLNVSVQWERTSALSVCPLKPGEKCATITDGSAAGLLS